MSNRKISVIVIHSNRLAHLNNLIAGLEQGKRLPTELLIIDIGEKPLSLSSSIPIHYEFIKRNHNTALPVGDMRNLGASLARYEHLVFLDVDCIPDRHFIDNIYKSEFRENALYMGQPKYLKSQVQEVDFITLERLSEYHPVRPVVKTCMPYEDYALFWSLTFFITKTTFMNLEGFDSRYTGYGAEDTDFAFKCRRANIDFILTPYTVFHQMHSFHRPPFNHFSAIINNCNVFYEKWGIWAMDNHLKAFAKAKLIDWSESSTQRIEILKSPSTSQIEKALVVGEAYA